MAVVMDLDYEREIELLPHKEDLEKEHVCHAGGARRGPSVPGGGRQETHTGTCP